jgi:hypothetical protein
MKNLTPLYRYDPIDYATRRGGSYWDVVIAAAFKCAVVLPTELAAIVYIYGFLQHL